MVKASNYIKFFFTILILAQASINVYAQNSKEEKYYTNSNRHWLAEIPIWVPGFRGQLAYGNYNFSSSGSDEEKEYEQLQNESGIQFYFVGRIVARYNNFWVNADAFSGKVNSAFSYTSLIENNEKEIVDITASGTIPRLVAGYSVWQQSNENHFKIEAIPYLGIRYVNIYLQSEVFDLTSIIDVRPNWVEPLIGLYVPLIYKRFKIEMQADYGTTGTKNSWVISNRYRYRISKLVDVQLGWNLIRLYHKGIVGSQELESTIRLFGPTAGVGFRF
ncbi:MAG: hypothetical protein KC469_01135 [Flavobacteriaceae bacterium]|jgi:hypothetical protein|nr:hypothetical protein [Flavobacteriaceae bacterium]